jgi:hypothetical protein
MAKKPKVNKLQVEALVDEVPYFDTDASLALSAGIRIHYRDVVDIYDRYSAIVNNEADDVGVISVKDNWFFNITGTTPFITYVANIICENGVTFTNGNVTSGGGTIRDAITTLVGSGKFSVIASAKFVSKQFEAGKYGVSGRFNQKKAAKMALRIKSKDLPSDELKPIHAILCVIPMQSAGDTYTYKGGQLVTVAYQPKQPSEIF